MEVKVGEDGKPVAYLSPRGSPGVPAPAAMAGQQQPPGQPGMEANANGLGASPSAPGMQVHVPNSCSYSGRLDRSPVFAFACSRHGPCSF